MESMAIPHQGLVYPRCLIFFISLVICANHWKGIASSFTLIVWRQLVGVGARDTFVSENSLRDCATSMSCNLVSVKKSGVCAFFPGVSTKDKDFEALLEKSDYEEDAVYIMECASGGKTLALKIRSTTPVKAYRSNCKAWTVFCQRVFTPIPNTNSGCIGYLKTQMIFHRVGNKFMIELTNVSFRIWFLNAGLETNLIDHNDPFTHTMKGWTGELAES